MAKSLLAHLYSHIRGSQEDVATYSLQYILSQSESLNDSFIRLISSKLKIDIKKVQFICQSVGENKERPDLSGVDAEGNEIFLGEAKFYAGLTANQPETYLDRLIKEKGLGLFFICPKKRKASLWMKLLDRCQDRNIENEATDYACIDGMHMSILTWDEIISDLYNVASVSATELISDIVQLSGFCAQMDSEAFVPFEQEDFGPDVARKMERYYEVIDATCDKLLVDRSLQATINGLRATPCREGYVRYIKLLDYGVAIIYKRSYWMKSKAEVPFWINIKDSNWKMIPEVQDLFNSVSENEKYDSGGYLVFALHVPLYEALDEIAESLCNQIKTYIEQVENKKGNNRK